MSVHVVSKAQFHRAGSAVRRDPNDSNDKDHGRGGKPRFSRSGSKTMKIAAGHLPPPQERHRHHRKNAPRSLRAR